MMSLLRKLIIPAVLFLFFTTLSACKKGNSHEEYVFNESYGDKERVVFSLSNDKITTAQTVFIKFTVSAPEDSAVTPPLVESELGKMKVIGRHESTPRLNGSNVEQVFSYELQPFLAGEYTIPALTFNFRSGQKENNVISKAKNITVTSVLTDKDTDIKDIFGIRHSKGSDRLYYIAAALLIAFLLIFFFIKHYKNKPVVVLTPKEKALQALNELLEKKLIEQGEYKLYYTDLSNILRNFIEKEFGISAPEKTTEEFLPDLQNNACFQDTQRELLKEFLQQSDLVKFANYEPEAETAAKAFELCRDFIESVPTVTDEQGKE